MSDPGWRTIRPASHWDVPIDTTPVHEQVLRAAPPPPTPTPSISSARRPASATSTEQINAFAGALQQKFGVKKGTRVALLLPNTPFFVIAYYAILRVGGTVVNCNPLYTVHELRHIVGNAGAELMVTLDLKLIFEKAEALVADGHVKHLIVCNFPEALPAVKKLLFKIAKRATSPRSRPARSPTASRISTH